MIDLKARIKQHESALGLLVLRGQKIQESLDRCNNAIIMIQGRISELLVLEVEINDLKKVDGEGEDKGPSEDGGKGG